MKTLRAVSREETFEAYAERSEAAIALESRAQQVEVYYNNIPNPNRLAYLTVARPAGCAVTSSAPLHS